MNNTRGLNNYCLTLWQSNPLRNLQHSVKALPTTKVPLLTESDSEFHTDATTSFSGSEDDLDTDGRVEQVEEQDTTLRQEMPVGVGKLEVHVGQLKSVIQELLKWYILCSLEEGFAVK